MYSLTSDFYRSKEKPTCSLQLQRTQTTKRILRKTYMDLIERRKRNDLVSKLEAWDSQKREEVRGRKGREQRKMYRSIKILKNGTIRKQQYSPSSASFLLVLLYLFPLLSSLPLHLPTVLSHGFRSPFTQKILSFATSHVDQIHGCLLQDPHCCLVSLGL